jgi:hypothetical protein
MVFDLDEGGRVAKSGQWQWSGLGPHARERLLPHRGMKIPRAVIG